MAPICLNSIAGKIVEFWKYMLHSNSYSKSEGEDINKKIKMQLSSKF